MPTRSAPRQVPRIYEFIKSQQKFHSIKMMCELLGVTRSGIGGRGVRRQS
jgi:hypothetical protein